MPTELAEQAWAVLRENDEGIFVKPSQRLYPFQWNWDSAFVALGLAGVDPERGRTEVRSLLRGQWADGMVPHIVFHTQRDDYRPGPELWQSAECDGAPGRPDVRADAAACPRHRDPRPPRGRAGSSVSGGGPAGCRGLARMVRARARSSTASSPCCTRGSRPTTHRASIARSSASTSRASSLRIAATAIRSTLPSGQPTSSTAAMSRSSRLSARAATVPRRRSTRRSPTTTFP